jgi:CheY-like chemotaxis protein
MFAQVDSSLERGRGGLGVGLSLAKSLVEMHGGRIEARSAGVGRGSEFVVHLPVVSEATPTAREAPEAETSTGPTYRVLVGDDNVDSALVLAAALRHAGHDVATAHDGHAILAEAGRFNPDIAMLDIGMPGLNGYDVARRLRETRGRDMTLIAITGWGQEEDRRRALEAGFDHHLTKPVDFATLDTLLRRLGRVGGTAVRP